MRQWLPSVVALAACSGTPGATDATPGGDAPGSSEHPDGVKSGARLKLDWIDFEGTKYWNGLYDSLRRESCYASQLPGGQLVCMPSDAAAVVFTDAACTQRVGQVYRDLGGCTRPPPTYLIEYAYGCTSYASRLYQRGAPVTTTQYYLASGVGCSGPYTSTSYDFYAPGAEVPMSELVPITLSTASGGRLVKVSYESVDGMRMPARIHDTLLDTDCYASGGSGATSATCMPSSASYSTYFSNAACTTAVAATETTCPPPRFIRGNPSGCPNGDRFYVGGAQITPPQLYVASGATCTQTTPPTESKFFAAGAALVLPTMMRSPDSTTSRLRPIHFALDSGPYRDYWLYDGTKLAECYPYTLADGSTRCLPAGGGSVSTMYTDAACTNAVEILDLYRGEGTCGAPAVPPYALKYIAPQSGQMCGSNYTVHKIEAPYTGASYRKLSNGSCLPYTPTVSVRYRASAAIPLTEFASGTKSTDP